MKKNFLHWALLLTAGLSLAMVSCDDTDNDDPAGTPVFPEAVEASILPGDTYKLTFDANLKWEASIPDAAFQAFYIQDGTQKTTKQYGEAGTAEVVIGAHEIETQDQAPSCEVTLTMGGQSKVIATLTISQEERTLTLRTSKMEDGDFAYATEEGGLSYEYDETPAQTIELAWPAGRSGYMYPILVEANFAWRLAEKSEWLAEENYTGEAGQQVEILLKADPTKYPLDGDQEGKFILCDRNNEDAKYAYTVKIPACRDYYSATGFVAESRFNAEGQFFNASASSWVNQGMHGYITSVEEPKIFKFAEVAGTLNADAAHTGWIQVEAEGNESDADNVLKERRYTISVEENTGEARKGVVLALLASVEISNPSDLLTGNEIKEEYKKYIVTTLNQSSNVAGEFVEFYEAPMADYSLTKLPKNDFPYEDKWASVPAIYNLTYTTEMDGEMAELKFNATYDSYEIYGEEGPYASSQLSPRWVDLADGYNGDNCKFIKIACTYENDSFVWTYEKPENPTAYFVFKNGGEIAGIIEFKFEGKQQGGGNEISLAQGNSESVTLVQLTSGDTDYDGDFGSMGVPQYKLTLTGTTMAYLNLPEYDESTYYENEELVSIYPAGNFHMLMYNSEEAGKTQIVFKSSWMNTASLIVEYKPE